MLGQRHQRIITKIACNINTSTLQDMNYQFFQTSITPFPFLLRRLYIFGGANAQLKNLGHPLEVLVREMFMLS